MGQKWTRVLLFSGKPLDTNMVLCCTEKLCGGTDTAPQGAHPLYRLSTASKQKIYQSEKRKVIGQTTSHERFSCAMRTTKASSSWSIGGRPGAFRCREPSNFCA